MTHTTHNPTRSGSAGQVPAERSGTASKSMHQNVGVWCDCCSCEIEPYWAEVARDMGVDLGSDYEDGE